MSITNAFRIALRKASELVFDDTTAQLGETDVQGAIEVVNDKVDSFEQIDIASTAEAQAGTNNTKAITPLRMREGFNASGDAPVFACRAWVNFNGTLATPTIRASGNVSSVTKGGTGNYTVNFTIAMPDANYTACISSGRDNTLGNQTTTPIANYSVGSFVITSNGTGEPMHSMSPC